MNMVLNDVCEVYSGYALKSFNEGKEGFSHLMKVKKDFQ